MRSEDGNIIQKCLDGESEAFGFIVDKYKESVYAFAYTKLCNFHDAVGGALDPMAGLSTLEIFDPEVLFSKVLMQMVKKVTLGSKKTF